MWTRVDADSNALLTLPEAFLKLAELQLRLKLIRAAKQLAPAATPVKKEDV